MSKKIKVYKKQKFAAYAGSLIQQSFGEKPFGHGGILWEINGKNITSQDFNIENDWVYLNEVLEKSDYDNLNVKKSEYATKNTQLKIHWKDYSVNINLENEQKIRNYFSKIYNIEKDSIKIHKKYLNTSLLSSKQIEEKLDINNKKGLQEIFSEYLEENGYSKEQIKELLEIDNIISDRLDINEFEKNTNWKIEKLWIDNFKSYDKAELDFINRNGIIQIQGKNQQGKTTLLDAICYMGFGTTLSTNKIGGALREKHGDNRYINNKRNKNYCLVGAQINAEGEKFIIERRTDRKVSKTNTISSVSTILDFYDDRVSEETKLTDEQKKDTQKKLENILGSFDDFIRLTLTNSENLNQLLSLDRATFIDSIIKDAGYDIFEKKSEVFKNYKKENLKDKIIIDLDQSEEELENHYKQKVEISNKIDKSNLEIENIKNNIIKKEKLKDSEIKMLNKIDENIAKLDIDDLNLKIEEYNNLIFNNIKTQNRNIDLMKNLKSEYDEDEYNSKHFEIRRLKDLNSDLKIKISNYDNRIIKENNSIDKVDSKIDQLTKDEIDKNRRKIEDIQDEIHISKKEFHLKIESEISKLQSEMKDYQFKIKSNETELNHIKETGKKIKKEIKKLIEDSICPTCGQEYTEDHKIHKEQIISEKTQEIQDLMVNVKFNMSEIQLFKNKIEGIEKEIQQIKNKNYIRNLKDLYEDVANEISVKEVLIKNIMLECSKLDNKNYESSPDVYQKVMEGVAIKEKCFENVEECERRKEKTKDEIKRNLYLIENIEEKLLKLEKEKEEVKTYEKLKQENNELKLKIENVKLIIENAKNKIEQYNNQLDNIERNKIIEKRISLIKEEIKEINRKKQDIIDKLDEDKSTLVVLTRDIEDITKRISLYKEQVKLQELYTEYSKIIHRDGIPTYLLKKSINLINVELDELLNNVDFSVRFDEDLRLKLSPKNNLKAKINALESSGKERTFVALALKTALRAINNKPKCDLSIFDEVMGKLVDESVNEFVEFLELLKQKISLIMIIEHNHTINYEYMINVNKDKKGISTLVYE